MSLPHCKRSKFVCHVSRVTEFLVQLFLHNMQTVQNIDLGGKKITENQSVPHNIVPSLCIASHSDVLFEFADGGEWMSG